MTAFARSQEEIPLTSPWSSPWHGAKTSSIHEAPLDGFGFAAGDRTDVSGMERSATAASLEALQTLFSGYADPPTSLTSVGSTPGGPTPNGPTPNIPTPIDSTPGIPAPKGSAKKEDSGPTNLPIGKGTHGSNVESIQRALNVWVNYDGRMAGYKDSTLSVDGKYGSNTEYVVARFQSSKNLSPTGAVNAVTYSALQPYGCSLLLTVDTFGGGV